MNIMILKYIPIVIGIRNKNIHKLKKEEALRVECGLYIIIY
jgi:hypothetical protein